MFYKIIFHCQVIREAGISDLSFHDLGHTFVTRAADAGVPLLAISRRDGIVRLGRASAKPMPLTRERDAHATD